MDQIGFDFGLLFLTLAVWLQIVEEWTARGLTDTSFLALGCLMAGAWLLGRGFLAHGDWIALGIVTASGGLGLGAIGLKVRDAIRSRIWIQRLTRARPRRG